MITIKAPTEWMKKRVARLSMIGECAIRGAIEKLKRSYFDSILEYGLAEGSKYYVDFKKLKENYDENTLPEWIEKMDRHEGVNLSEVYGAYVEQMTALRVIKVSESASILRNVLRRDVEDVLSGFECFYDKKHVTWKCSNVVAHDSSQVNLCFTANRFTAFRDSIVVVIVISHGAGQSDYGFQEGQPP